MRDHRIRLEVADGPPICRRLDLVAKINASPVYCLLESLHFTAKEAVAKH